MVVGLLGNESPDSNRFILVTPKSENDVRLQVTLGNQNPTGLPVGAVRESHGENPVYVLFNRDWGGEDTEDNGVAVLIEDGEVTEVGYKDIAF